jgi:hypothetical protein
MEKHTHVYGWIQVSSWVGTVMHYFVIIKKIIELNFGLKNI